MQNEGWGHPPPRRRAACSALHAAIAGDGTKWPRRRPALRFRTKGDYYAGGFGGTGCFQGKTLKTRCRRAGEKREVRTVLQGGEAAALSTAVAPGVGPGRRPRKRSIYSERWERDAGTKRRSDPPDGTQPRWPPSARPAASSKPRPPDYRASSAFSSRRDQVGAVTSPESTSFLCASAPYMRILALSSGLRRAPLRSMPANTPRLRA